MARAKHTVLCGVISAAFIIGLICANVGSVFAGDQAPTDDEVTSFVRSWFSRADDHASVEEMKSMLSPEGFVMKFPDITMVNYEQYEKWYIASISRFFDQKHTIKKIEIKRNGDEINISILVTWRAHTWDPPQPISKWYNSDAVQSWKVIKDAKSGKLVIKECIIDSLVNNV